MRSTVVVKQRESAQDVLRVVSPKRWPDQSGPGAGSLSEDLGGLIVPAAAVKPRSWWV